METLTELVAKITTDAAGLKSGLSDAERKTEASSKKMADSLKKVGTAMAASGAAITAALGLMGKAAIDEEINIKRLATTINNSGTAYDNVKDSLEALIATTQRKTGVADDEQRDILNRLILVTNDYGKALELLPTVLDLAAAGEMDATTAATYLGKAFLELEGGAEEVSVRFGQASLQFKNMEDIQNRVAGAAENLANPLSVLKATMGDISEVLGSFLIPSIKNFVNIVAAVSEGIQNWIKLNPELAEGFVLATAKLGGLLLVIGSIILIIPKVIGFITAITTLMGPWGWAILAVSVVVGYLVAELLGLSDVMAGLKDIMVDVEKQMFVMRVEQALSVDEWAKITEQGYLTEQQFKNLAGALNLTTKELYTQMEASGMLQVSMTSVGDTNLYLKDTTKRASDEVKDLTEQLQDASSASKDFNREVEATKQAIASATWQAEGYTYRMQLFNQAEIDAAKASGKKVEALGTQDEITAKNVDTTNDYIDTINEATNSANIFAATMEKVSELKAEIAGKMGMARIDAILAYQEAAGEEARRLQEELGISGKQAAAIAHGQAEMVNGEVISTLPGNMGEPVPYYQSGGIVNETGLAYLHQGETVIPANESGGKMMTIILELDGRVLSRAVMPYATEEIRLRSGIR